MSNFRTDLAGFAETVAELVIQRLKAAGVCEVGVGAPVAATSPFIRGDAAATRFVGYRDVKAFLRFARLNGIRPRRSQGLAGRPGQKIWSRAEILRALDPGATVRLPARQRPDGGMSDLYSTIPPPRRGGRPAKPKPPASQP